MPARCFVAFDLPDVTLDLLAHAHDVFVDEAPSWGCEKSVRRDLRHVTAKFIGRVEDSDLDRLLGRVDESAADHVRFELGLASIRAVPSPRRARMVWAAFSECPPEATALVGDLDDLLEDGFGIERADRAFTPHVTLARARSTREAPVEAIQAASAVVAGAPCEGRTVPVRDIVVYSSLLSRGGPTYETLARFALERG